MATPPTFVADYSTGFSATTSPRTVSTTVGVGDLLAVMGGTEDGALPLTTPSGGGLTYTLQQSIELITNFATAYGWTAPSNSSQTYTLSQGFTGGGTHLFGSDALRFSGSDGVGASAKTNVTSGAPSLNITTTQDNSAICVVVTDWNATDGASRTWRTVNSITPSAGNGYERVYFFDSSRATAYVAYYPDAGAAGLKTVGLSAPTGQKYSIVAVEIKGTAGASATWLPQPGRRRPPTLRVLPSAARTTSVVRAQVNPPYPVQEVDQTRRLRGIPARRARVRNFIPAQVNPPIPIQEIDQARRLRGILTRRGHTVTPVPAQVVATPPAFPFAELGQRRTIRGLLARRGRVATVPLVGATPPANPVLPLGPARRLTRLLAPPRRERLAGPPPVDQAVPVAQRRRLRILPARRRPAVAVVQQAPAPLTPTRRDRPDLPVVRRGRIARPLGVQLPPVPPVLMPVVTRIRQWRPFHRAGKVWNHLFPGVDHQCTVTRPSTGTTPRPNAGITARVTSSTARPDSGMTARPDTGITEDPC